MNILGLHFGHDAAVCVLRDGVVLAYGMRERHARIKHAISLEFKTIEQVMKAAGLRWEEIDYCAITSTQNIELIIDDPAAFSISFEAHPQHLAPCELADLVRAQNLDPASLLTHSLLDILYDPKFADTSLRRLYGQAFPEYRTRTREDFAAYGTMDLFVDSPSWPGATFSQIMATDYSAILRNDSARQGFHYPVTVRLGGQRLPGYFVAHHAAHAASSFYASGFDRAAILTHDGFANGLGYLSGMFFWGEGHRIRPITPHHLALGGFYEEVGKRLGLGDGGASGKLMGLAGYGQPRFFDRRFVGNQYDWIAGRVDVDVWMEHCLGWAREMSYDVEPLGDPARVRAPINADIAASTQKVFEETYLLAVETFSKVLRHSGLDSPNLCFSGGCALNCPSNSRVMRESRFSQLFIEPGCDDSGLAMGAAGWLYHNVLDHPLPAGDRPSHPSPYLGMEIAHDAILFALNAAGEAIRWTVCLDAAQAAADDLVADRVVGWFEGRSEIGPRALGHRSILADPRVGANWGRVNGIKGREAWRPFAPAVLASEAAEWFLGIPASSPYMLFTGLVRSHDLPAITHADGTARVQTVESACGEFYRVIESFFSKTGVPMVLNTSFNGPGEPIVESPEDALRFLMQSPLDVLYLGGMRVVRRSASVD